MGIAQWNALPETDSERTAIQKFNGFGAIRAHLDQYVGLKDYLCGRSKERPEAALTCHAECKVAQWMHSEKRLGCMSRELLDAVCGRCHEFQEEAAQSLLLEQLRKCEKVSSVARSFRKLDSASKKFQTALADLHIECWDS
ncbi:MAG: hypothetical protein Q8L69_08650 [Gallionellaceae bacterium]|nr:hypothetical protein [Gallionellaceae bacterium]